MANYDISEVFQKIEEDMIASMSRNLKRHLQTEKDEDLNYTMWQAEQLSALNEFKRKNSTHFKKSFSTINEQIEDVLRKAHETGEMEQEIKILEAIREGWSTASRSTKAMQGEFFKINERKLNALINSTQKDMVKAENAVLRKANDEYRKIIFNSQAYYNTGAGTLPQCVDMATKDFLSKGITCIEYANGALVGIDSYARMAIRTAQTRAYLLGESAKRDEWGVSTVIVNKRGVACPKCLRYVGKVFYDDVWGSTPVPSPAKYPRLSEAMAGGLYHPNCKDIHTTFFEGISTPPEPMTNAEKREAERVYNLEQRQRYNERQIRKYKRLSDGSVDPENKAKYQEKLEMWQNHQKKFVKANGDVLKRRYENESTLGIGPIDNVDTRKTVERIKREAAMEQLEDSGIAMKQPRKIKDLTNGDDSGIMPKTSNKAPIKSPGASYQKQSTDHAVAGSDLLSKEAKTKLQRSERILVGNRYETAEIYDTSGNLVFRKKGTRDEVSFTSAELKKMKNCIVTHNHPSGSTFSSADIALLKRTGAAEYRACTRGGTFVIRPPKKWPESLKTFKEIDIEMDRIFDDIGSKYRDIAAQEGKSILFYLEDMEKETLRVFGDKHGFYTAFEDVMDMEL